MTDELIKTITPAAMAGLLKDAGYRASEIERNGTVSLASASQGLNFTVRFGNRAEAPADGFLDFSFSVALQMQAEVPPTLVPAWNQTRRFARLSLQAQFLVLEMDVTVAGGVTTTNLRAHIELWDRMLQELLLHLRQSLAPVVPTATTPEPIAAVA